jgi:hypothetical protein
LKPGVPCGRDFDIHRSFVVGGVFDDSTLDGGLRFRALNPVRIADTRSNFGATGPLGPNSTATVTAPGTVANPTTEALALNVTAVTERGPDRD